ncbi:MAG: hypothetical protein IT181_11745 [Acidobacteria bacterium]|nr:hypothetical protein [Acidobacteriota bacterium]
MRLWIGICLLAALPALAAAQPAARPPTDLDRLMEDVVRQRDDNWKKLQQYILTERQKVTVTGPDGLRLFGASHAYQWFVKDGFFIRSPLTANGVTIAEGERRRSEDHYLTRMKERDARKAKRDAEKGLPPAPTSTAAVGDLLSQQAEPSFVSAAYFLEFKFEPGRYALAGRETLDGREVLRIEYHPARLFSGDEEVTVGVGSKGASVSRNEREARRERRRSQQDRDEDARIEQQMNKTALITLWVLRDEKQIVRYVFDNVDWGFLPGRSVLRFDDLTASMRMHEAFPGIWLPQAIAANVRVATALGRTGASYDVTYSEYRQAGVTVRVK